MQHLNLERETTGMFIMATKDSWFEHLAITSGKSEFLDPVSDTEYNELEVK